MLLFFNVHVRRYSSFLLIQAGFYRFSDVPGVVRYCYGFKCCKSQGAGCAGCVASICGYFSGNGTNNAAFFSYPKKNNCGSRIILIIIFAMKWAIQKLIPTENVCWQDLSRQVAGASCAKEYI